MRQKSIYVAKVYHNPAWGLRSPDNRDEFKEVFVGPDRLATVEAAERYIGYDGTQVVVIPTSQRRINDPLTGTARTLTSYEYPGRFTITVELREVAL